MRYMPEHDVRVACADFEKVQQMRTHYIQQQQENGMVLEVHSSNHDFEHQNVFHTA